MKSLYKYLFFAFIACSLFSCSDDDDDQAEKIVWNRARTTNILVYSHLSELNLFASSNYLEIASSIGNIPHSVVLLDRSNVMYANSSMINTGAKVAVEATKVPLFVPISYSTGDKKYDGSTVLLEQNYASMEQVAVKDHCRMLQIKTMPFENAEMLFGTLSINNSAQIEPATLAIKDKMEDGSVTVGSIKREFIASFESQLAKLLDVDSYTFTEVKNSDSKKEYCLYVVTSNKWIYRGVKEKMVTDDVKSYQLQIESLK